MAVFSFMANPGLVIELTNYTAFSTELKNLDKVLDSLDTRLASLKKVFDGLDKNVTKSANSLHKLGTVLYNISQISNLQQTIISLGHLPSVLERLSNAAKGGSGRNIDNMAHAIANLSNVFLTISGGSKNFKRGAEGIEAFARALPAIAKTLSVIDVKSVRTLDNLSTVLVKMSTQLGLVKGKNLKQATQAIGELSILFGQLPRVFDELRKSAAAANNGQVSLDVVVNTFKLFKSVFDTIGKTVIKTGELKNLHQIGPTFQILTTLFNTIGALGAVQVKAAQQTIRAMHAIMKDLVQFILDTKQLDIPKQRGFLGIFGNKAAVDGLSVAMRGFAQFAEGMADSLRRLEAIRSPNALRAASGGLRAIFGMLKEFQKLGAETGGQKALRILSLGKINSRLTDAFRGIRPLTKLLAEALGPLSEIKGAENIRAVANFSRTLLDVMAAFQKIPLDSGRFASVFGKDRSNRFTKFFQGLKPLAKLMRESLNEFEKLKVRPGTLNSVSNFTKAISDLFKSLVSGFAFDEGSIKRFTDGIKEVIRAILDGFTDSKLAVVFAEEGEDSGHSFLKGLKKALQISSPSRAMFNIGTDVMKGFVNGVGSFTSRIGSLAKGIGTAFINAFKKAIIGPLDFMFNDVRRVIEQKLADIRRLISESLTQTGRTLTQAGRTLFQGGLTALTAGGLTGFLTGQAATFVGDFDQVIRQIGVFGDVTGDALEDVQTQILEFSSATKFGPQESALALLGLQKAGLSTADSLAALPQVGDFAAAAQLDLARATELAVQTMNAFGLTTKDIPSIIDNFVGGADISTASAETLAQALQFAGTSAAQLGIPLSDVTAALALLSDRGIVGERAGTGLRAVLDSLAAPTAEAASTLQDLNVSLQDAEGNFVGLDSVVLQLQQGIQSMRDAGAGDVEIISQLSSLGDRNAITSLLALIDEGSGTMIEFEDGSKRAATAFEEYTMRLADANDAATVAAGINDTFKGRLESLRGSIQTLIISAMQPFLNDNVKPLLEDLTEFVNILTKLPKPVLKFSAALTFATAAISSLLGVLALMAGAALLVIGPALTTLGTLLSLVFNPVAIATFIAAFTGGMAIILPLVAAFAAGIALVIAQVKHFRDNVRENVGGAGDRFAELKRSIGELFTTISDLGGAVGTMFRLFHSDGNELGGAKEGIDRLGGAFSTVAGTIAFVTDQVEKFVAKLNEVKLFIDFINATRDLQQRGNTREVQLGEDLAITRKRIDLIKELQSLTNKQRLGIITPEDTARITEMRQELEQIEETSRLMDKLDIGQTTSQSLSDIQQAALRAFKGTSLFGFLFGEDDAAVFRAVNAVGQIEDRFEQMGKSTRQLSKGIREIFSGKFNAGVKTVTKSIGQFGEAITGIFETLTGVDISDEFQKKLREGDFIGIFKDIGKSVLRGVISLIPFLIEGVGIAVERALKGITGGSIRLFTSLLGIDTLDPIFLEIDKAIQSIVDFVKRTLNSTLDLAQGDIGFREFLQNIFGFDNVIDKLRLTFSLQELEGAFGDLKTALSEFSNESGLSNLQLNLEGFASAFDTFKKSAPELVISAIHGLSKALITLGVVIAFIGPIFKPIFEGMAEAIGSFSVKLEELNEDGRLFQAAKGLTALAVAIGLLTVLAAPAILATIGTALGALAVALIGLLFVVNFFNRVADPLLEFFADLGDLVDLVAEGDFDAVGEKLVELGEDLTGIFVDAPIAAFADTIADILGIIQDLTGVDLQPLIAVMDSLGDMIANEGASSVIKGLLEDLIKLLDSEFGAKLDLLIINMELALAKFRESILTVLTWTLQQVEQMINGAIDIFNQGPFGEDVDHVSLKVDLNMDEARAKVDELEKEKVHLEANIDLVAEARNLDSEEAANRFISSILGSDFQGAAILLDESGISQEDLDTAIQSIDWAGAGADAQQRFLSGLAETQKLSTSSSDTFGGIASTFFTDIQVDAKTAGEQTAQGYGQGVTAATPQAVGPISAMIQNAKLIFANELETNSPSRWAMTQGAFLVEGFVLGVQNNVGRLSGVLGIINNLLGMLQLSVAAAATTIESEMARASSAMFIHATLIQQAAQMMVTSLQNVAIAAGAAMQSVNAVTATAGGTTPPPPPENAPGFARGGFTGSGTSAFMAKLHPNEFVVPKNGALVLRDDALASVLSQLVGAMRAMSAVPAPAGARSALPFGVSQSVLNANQGGSSYQEVYNVYVNEIPSNDARLTEAVARGVRNAKRSEPFSHRAQKRGIT